MFVPLHSEVLSNVLFRVQKHFKQSLKKKKHQQYNNDNDNKPWDSVIFCPAGLLFQILAQQIHSSLRRANGTWAYQANTGEPANTEDCSSLPEIMAILVMTRSWWKMGNKLCALGEIELRLFYRKDSKTPKRFSTLHCYFYDRIVNIFKHPPHPPPPLTQLPSLLLLWWQRIGRGVKLGQGRKAVWERRKGDTQYP